MLAHRNVTLVNMSLTGPETIFLADAVVAAPEQKLRLADGTSFATPFVTAAYAVGLAGARQRGDLTSALSAAALDLGRPGRDQVYGWGLLQYSPLRGC